MALAAPPFAGFSPEAIQFLADLAVNNDRAWFQPRKAEYERLLKEPFEAMIAALAERLEARGVPLLADPKRSPFRIYRDTRFSKDKTPYKTHIAAVFTRRGGEKNSGYYFSVSPDEIEAGGGVYNPPAADLRVMRGYLAEHHEEFRRITAAPAVKRLFGEMTGSSLARAPKGFPADHPAADLLRRKQFMLFRPLDVSLATSPKLYREIVKRFEAATPMLQFLDRPFVQTRTSRLSAGTGAAPRRPAQAPKSSKIE
jgi:uncharacterized protein (TIGR02453 family)